MFRTMKEYHKPPFLHQMQLSFHIIPIIIAFLPLDSIHRSIYRRGGLKKGAHVKVDLD